MTIIYQENIRNMYLATGIMVYLTQGDPQTVVSASITIYSGAQPTAATIESNWANYNTSYLLHLPNSSIQQPNAKVPGIGVSIVNYGLPATQIAANTGTATWAILWIANVAGGSSSGQISGDTLPSTTFLVLPVSDLTQTYPVRLPNTSITSGLSYSIGDLNIFATGGIV
jgi:hypothetical protein